VLGRTYSVWGEPLAGLLAANPPGHILSSSGTVMIEKSEYLRQPRKGLLEMVARLDPILNPHGFTFVSEGNAVSSGGPFANGFYVRLPIKIGLVVRDSTFGMPVYYWGECHCGHDDLIAKLGRLPESTVRFNEERWSLETTDGGNIVDAVVADVENIILPTILRDPAEIQGAVAASHKERMARWGVKD
jgi:hypothetical protein